MENKTASYEAPRMETVEIEAENCILVDTKSGTPGDYSEGVDDETDN